MDNKIIDKKAVRLHHVSSHFTNGLFPTSLLFLILYLVFPNKNFEVTSFYLLLIATIASPFTYLSGIVDWFIRFKKARTPIFNKKVYWGLALTILSMGAVCWRMLQADYIYGSMFLSILYVGLNIIITAIVSYLGYLGGKFIMR